MKLVSFNAYQVGVVQGSQVVDVSTLLPASWRGTIHAMIQFICDFEQNWSVLRELPSSLPRLPLDAVTVLPPIARPGQILGAPTNYFEHRQEMQGTAMTDPNRRGTPETLGFFWKSPMSVVGPSDAVLLPPLAGRRFDHEAERGVVIGRAAQGVAAQDALSYVFGYTCVMDLTMRWTETQKEERSMRKSFASFTPMGPCLVTADEIADPHQLEIRLWVNEELRQSAHTAQMIVPVPRLIELATQVTALMPGDVIATGTPAGVGALEPGDTVRLTIESVGTLALPVGQRGW